MTSTTFPTLETLNAALAVAVQMADDPNVDQETRASAEAFADAVREEIGRWNANAKASMTQKTIDWSLEVRKFERKCSCRWVGNRRVKAYRISGTQEAAHHSMLCAYRRREQSTGGAA